jgi:hypothetical protein
MDIWTAIERLGFPIVICTIITLGFFRFLRWLGTNIVTPVAKSHIALVDEVKTASKTNTETLSKVTQILAAKAKALTAIAEQNSTVVQLSQEANKKLDGIVKAIPVQTEQLIASLKK